mmetsp:Transcript_27300/g.63397  ORF Transcript_27300/g.63397 Transcript_27300/m.63397 type:complete len:86 (+) Transcript_27300:472-729(+)
MIAVVNGERMPVVVCGLIFCDCLLFFSEAVQKGTAYIRHECVRLVTASGVVLIAMMILSMRGTKELPPTREACMAKSPTRSLLDI